jgi:methylmalonyl-CoA mutase, C-terminal domain
MSAKGEGPRERGSTSANGACDRPLRASAWQCSGGRGMSGNGIIPKVLVTKIGFDGHDRGSRVVAAALRDAGMEVIYTPPWQEIPAVVKLAMEEDVDVIGVSSLATDHLIVPKLMEALRDAGLTDVGVIVGGIVPDDEEENLLAAGVARVFHPGSSMSDIAAFVRDLAAQVRTRRIAA